MESELGWEEIDRHGHTTKWGNTLWATTRHMILGELEGDMDVEAYKAFGKEKCLAKKPG